MLNRIAMFENLSKRLSGKRLRQSNRTQSKLGCRKVLRLESLEKRNLLAGYVVAPVDVDLESSNGSYLQSLGGNANWLNGSGLSNPSIVETGDPIPTAWPTHAAGHSADRVTRIRDANEFNTLTFDLGEALDINGMVLWNGSEPNRPSRGFENTVLSYSTDGGVTFSGSDTLTWMNRSEATADPLGHTPEVQMLPATVTGVTHLRMIVDNFSAAGSDAIVAADEIRFLGEGSDVPSVANLSVRTVDGEYDLTQGKEGTRAIEFTVTLSEHNVTGAPITFDLDDLGTGNATSGDDYVAIAADAQISIPFGSDTGTLGVIVVDDFLIEPTESVHAQISSPSHASVTIDNATAVATIGDNDTAGVTITGADDLAISEDGETDTYTITLDTIPTGVVEITATADAQTQVSIDGVNFGSTAVLNFIDMTPQTVTVRAVDDASIEGDHSSVITHAITGAIADPNYPDVTVESLYTVNGTDRPFQELIDSGDLPTGSNTTIGITGSEVDVNNAVLEQGLPSNAAIPQNIKIHTLANSFISRNQFNRWTRWYQEDGKTQVYRVFQGEENVRNDRALAARIESFSPGWQKGVWNDFTARYTILKPQSMSIFQSYQTGVEWSAHVGMADDGSINFSHRRNYGGGEKTIRLAEDMVGKAFEVRVRDNGHDYEVYFNGELKGKGYWERPDSNFTFRWGMYRGARPMTRDALVFVNNVTMTANTSAPTGMVPYRLATTSLSIDGTNVQIDDNDGQRPFIEQTVQGGTRILAEQFDFGGPLVAYHDTTDGNRGGQARPDDDVDLFAGSVVLSDIANGEWLEFTRDVVPGVYDIDVRTWSNSTVTKGVRILIAENALSSSFTELGFISVPDTDNVRISQTIENVDLTEWGGEDRVIRLEFVGSNFSYDWIEFKNELDFGDAPESYSTLLADDGARHAATGPQLGATRDSENDGAPSSNAAGDGSDEDGVLFGAIGAGSPGAAVNIELVGASQARIDAWIDFDRNGNWDASEKILSDFLVNESMQTINYDLPADLMTGDAYARVRISSAGGLGPNGIAADGEVEDYVVSVVAPPIVESVVINGDTAQRSSLDTVRVTFDRVVDIDTAGVNPFQFNPVGSSDVIPTNALVLTQLNGKTMVDLTFVSGGAHVTNFGSLRDGIYELQIDASRVTSLGAWLDGDDGSASVPYVTQSVDNFFRKYGDTDGDGGVGLTDFAAFRSTFGRSPGDVGYLTGLDSDGDQTIGLGDFAAFRANFGS